MDPVSFVDQIADDEDAERCEVDKEEEFCCHDHLRVGWARIWVNFTRRGRRPKKILIRGVDSEPRP